MRLFANLTHEGFGQFFGEFYYVPLPSCTITVKGTQANRFECLRQLSGRGVRELQWPR